MNIQTYLKFTTSIIRRNLGLFSLPFKLTHAITYRCNLKCTICRIWEKEERKELETEQINEFYRENRHFLWIDISGGEIFLREDLLDIIHNILKTQRNLFLLHFPTNGYLTDSIVYYVKEFLKMNPAPAKIIISVALDGPPRIHDKLRGVAGSYEKSLQTYILLKQIKGVEVYLGMTLCTENMFLIDETVQSVKKEVSEFSYKDLHINVINHSPHYFNNLSQPAPPSDKLIQEIIHFMKKRGLSIYPTLIIEKLFLSNLVKFLKTKRLPMPCEALKSSLFLDPYGDIYPCHIFSEKITNINGIDNNLLKLYELKKTDELRKKIQNSECPRCWTPCEANVSILTNLFRLHPEK